MHPSFNRNGMLVRLFRLRPTACFTLVILLAALAGCSRTPTQPITISGDTLLVTTFDHGWDGWERDTAFVRDAFEFALRKDVPGTHSQCAWMAADNSTDFVHQWIVREHRVPPGDYHVLLTFDIGPDAGLESHLLAIAAVTPEQPRASADHTDFTPLGAIALDPRPVEPTMLSFTHSASVDAHHGAIYAAVGYRSGFEIWNGVCLDNIRIEIRRAN